MPHKEPDIPSNDALDGDNIMPEPPDMMNNPPMPQDNMNQNDVEGNDFDNMGETDDGLDPKKSVQQLTGKLSQELRSYNNDQEQPDEDLNKYVAGMIIPQATKAMTDKGKKEVINKIKKGITDDEIEDDSMEMDDADGIENMQIESRIYEIINNILDDTEKRKTQKVSNKTLPKKSPFRSNR